MTPIGGKRGQNGSVYHQLKRLLVDHRFRPGEQLQITALADQFGVSNTPVREALNRLYGEALLVSVPNKGFFAKTLNVQEMCALSELGFVLLRHAIDRNTASFATDGLIDPVARPTDPAEPSNGLADAALTAQARFIEQLFERIVALAQNEAMLAVIRNIHDRTHYIRLIDLGYPGHVGLITGQLRALVEHLQLGDHRGAIEILGVQLERTLSIMPRLVRDGISRQYT